MRSSVDVHDRSGIAVIIPTFNEAAIITACLARLAAYDIAQIVVCDGGSTDETARLAATHPKVTVIHAKLGRGSQLRAGVAASSAPLLLLLHADTCLPMSADKRIRQALADPSVAAGCFRLRFASDRFSLTAWAWFSRFETSLTSFGDQAFFMRRSSLEAAGGIADWPLLEDVDVRHRLRKIGRFVKLQPAVTTSARRFERVGVLRCQLRNALIIAAFRLGVPPTRLARYYRATET